MSYLLKSIVFSFFFTAVSCAQSTTIANEMQGFEAEVDSLMQVYHAVGLSVAIIKDGETVYTNGFGYRELEKKLPVNENTVFAIGSCTKAFTASILGILENKKKLKLTDKPSKYIPELEFYNSEMNETIQIKNLLSHSTGISGRGFDTSSVLFLSEDKEIIIPKAKYFKPLSAVGERFIYNNSAYTLAGIIVERITDKSWEENLSQLFFVPLEMKNSYTGFNNASINSNFSYGYAVNDSVAVKVLPEIIPTKAPAGDVFSSVSDMAKWIQVWLDKGMYNGKQILPEKYIKESTTPQQQISDNANYGYGWIMQNFHGYEKVEHSGAISGYSSNVVFLPSENIGIVILTNQSISNISFVLTDNILNRLFSIDTDEVSQEIRFERTATIISATTNTVLNNDRKPSHALNKLVGDYFNPGFGNVSISFKDETLYADFPFTKLRLQHREDNVFIDYFTEEIPLLMGNYMVFEFVLGESGQISQLSINLDETPVIFKRSE